MKKILMIDNCENESTIDVDDAQDEHTGGDSSKSNSVTSEHSVHSVGVSASSQSSSTNSLPAGGDDRRGRAGLNHAAAAAVSDHGTNNFATIRTTSIVTKEQKEHMQVIWILLAFFNRLKTFKPSCFRRKCTSKCPDTNG